MELRKRFSFPLRKIFLSNGSLSVLGQLLYSATNFFIAIFLGRFFDQKTFGSFLILYSIWLLVFFVQKGVCVESLFVHGKGEGKEKILNKFFIMQCVYSVIISLILFAAYYIGMEFILLVTIYEWIVFSMAVLFLSWREFFRAAKMYQLDYVGLVFFDFLYAFLIICFFILMYVEDSLTLRNSWLMISVAAALLISLDVLLGRAKFKLLLGKGQQIVDSKYRGFMVWNGVVNVMVWSYANAYKFILLLLLGPVSVAAIGACNYLVQLSSPILNGVQNYYLIKISQAKEDKKKTAKKEAVLIIMVIAFCFSVPLIVVPEELLRILFDDKYIGYGVFVQFYGLSLIVTSIGRVYHMKLLSNNMAGRLAFAYIVSLPISMLVLVFSVEIMGVNGMNVYILSSSLLFAIVTYIVSSVDKSSFTKLMDLGR